MYMRTIRTTAVCVSGFSWNSIRQSFRFGNQADHVHTESINAFFTPPVHHLKHLIPHFWIVPVEIRLFFRKQMQEIHICLWVIFPCRTTETGSPIIRLFSVFSFSPDIKIAVWIIHALSAFHKPCMLIGCMIDNQIHHDLNSQLMCPCKHSVIIFHGSEFFHDCLIIADVVSIVIVR